MFFFAFTLFPSSLAHAEMSYPTGEGGKNLEEVPRGKIYAFLLALAKFVSHGCLSELAP